MRFKKDYLKDESQISQEYPTLLSNSKAIVTRDRNDIISSDMLFSNLIGSKTVSIGTMIEYGWGDAFRKPIVSVIEERNIHNHPFIKELSGFVVDDLNQGIFVVRAVLSR